MKDFDGFSPAVELRPYDWYVNGPDNLDHKVRCDFPTNKGMLACTCNSTRGKYSEWWNQWIEWNYQRVITDPAAMPVEWPTTSSIGIQGHGPETPPEEPAP